MPHVFPAKYLDLVPPNAEIDLPTNPLPPTGVAATMVSHRSSGGVITTAKLPKPYLNGQTRLFACRPGCRPSYSTPKVMSATLTSCLAGAGLELWEGRERPGGP